MVAPAIAATRRRGTPGRLGRNSGLGAVPVGALREHPIVAHADVGRPVQGARVCRPIPFVDRRDADRARKWSPVSGLWLVGLYRHVAAECRGSPPRARLADDRPLVIARSTIRREGYGHLAAPQLSPRWTAQGRLAQKCLR